MKIAYIDPVAEKAYFEEIVEEIRKYKLPETIVDYFCLEEGGDSLEYMAYEATLGKGIIKKVKEIEPEYDAVIIGCFLDPFVEALKECCKEIIVVGVCEAAVKIASSLGRRISVIAPQKKHTVIFEEVVARYCPAHTIASIESLDLPVNQIQADTDCLRKRMKEIGDRCKETYLTDVLVLGCTMETGQFETLQAELGIPVVDAASAALKYAEMLVSCKEKCGWQVPDFGVYSLPTAEELMQYLK